MKKITIVLSLIVAIVTLYVLTFPAITLNTVGEYKLSLNDSLVNDSYSWKNENGYVTSFNLKLTYSDTEGNLFDGKNIDVNISSDAINHGFTFGATKNDIIDLLKENEIETINTDNGKYIFEHAEVFVNDTWQTLSLNELTLSKIWCKNCLSETEPEDKQYGWYGSYGDDSTEFLINDSTEFKLIYKFEEKVEVKNAEKAEKEVKSSEDKKEETKEVDSKVTTKKTTGKKVTNKNTTAGKATKKKVVKETENGPKRLGSEPACHFTEEMPIHLL